MPAPKTIYTCRDCGGTSPKWLGQCPHCKAWNTLEESIAEPAAARVRAFMNISYIGLVGPEFELRSMEYCDVDLFERFFVCPVCSPKNAAGCCRHFSAQDDKKGAPRLAFGDVGSNSSAL